MIFNRAGPLIRPHSQSQKECLFIFFFPIPGEKFRIRPSLVKKTEGALWEKDIKTI